ncbi:hypothetical protein KEM56_005580 [Ascosphaera pollenicola]|nr:hypothetical protein KEM56_005580 [Ascosphaera pollenicola]
MENAGPLKTLLERLDSWLIQNPNEVVTLLFTQGQRFDVETLDRVFQSTDITQRAYVPPTNPAPLPFDKWPTLGDLIASGKRLIVFIDYNANTASVPYLLNEFDYFFETPFSPTDSLFRSCDIQRPPNTTADGKLYIVNHNLNKRLGHKNLLIPDWRHAIRTNSMKGAGSIGGHASRCYRMHGRRPNVILLDYVMQGQVMQSQEMLNGFMTPAGTRASDQQKFFNVSSLPPELLNVPESGPTDIDDSEEDLLLAVSSLRLLKARSGTTPNRLRNLFSMFDENGLTSSRVLLWGAFILLHV